jgi:hypothetical protein
VWPLLAAKEATLDKVVGGVGVGVAVGVFVGVAVGVDVGVGVAVGVLVAVAVAVGVEVGALFVNDVTGTELDRLVPSPRAPSRLRPQHFTEPSLR